MKALLLFASVAALLFGAELAGRFQGDWSSNASGAAGTIQLTVKAGPDAVQTSEASFTLSGQPVKTKVRTLTISGNSLEMSYEFDAQGTALVSKIKGQLDGDKLSGTYETTYAGSSEKVDQGIFKTTLSK